MNNNQRSISIIYVTSALKLTCEEGTTISFCLNLSKEEKDMGFVKTFAT